MVYNYNNPLHTWLERQEDEEPHWLARHIIDRCVSIEYMHDLWVNLLLAQLLTS